MRHKLSVKKFIFSLALAVGLALGMAAVCSFADTYTDNQGVKYEYSTSDHTASVVGNTNVPQDITIPSTITIGQNEYTVTEIGQSAFKQCYGLQSITIPSSVTNIGEEAFSNSGLVSIIIQDGVTTIGNNAFKQCYGLTSITIPNSVTTIGEGAFSSCSSLKRITIPENVTTIGNNVFSGCYDLEEVFATYTLPTSVGINSNADVWRYEVLDPQTGAPEGKTLVEITSVAKADGSSSSVSSITCTAMGGNYVIRSVPSGINLTHDCGITNNNLFNFTDGNGISWTCTILQENNQNTNNVSIVPTDKNAISGAIEIPSVVLNGCMGYNVTKVGNHAFFGCTDLTSITIPEGVTTIEDMAFIYCRSLTNITIPSSVSLIGSSAFEDCSNLTSVNFQNTQENPSQLSTIISGGFRGCSKLTSITIPSGVESIERKVFGYCTELKNVTFENPSQLSTIGEQVFEYCSSLESITLPTSVESVGTDVFTECSSLENVFVKSNLNLSLPGIREAANIWRYEVLTGENVSQDGKTHVKITSVENSTGTPLSLNEPLILSKDAMGEGYVIDFVECCATGVENQAAWYVYGEHSLTPHEAKAATCTEVGFSSACWSCSNCEKYFSDGEGITEIAESSVLKPTTCHNLTYHEAVEATCTEDGHVAGYTCSLCNEHFSDPQGTTEISEVSWIVPATGHTLSEVTGYTWVKSGDVWEYREIGKCANCLAEGVEGKATDVFVPDAYDCSGIPSTTRIWKYSVDDGKATITGIAHPDQFMNVEIPARIGGNENGSYPVTAIGANVFKECTSLTSITIPSGVTSIKGSTFSGCTSLESVTFENSSQLSTIEASAFYNCNKLTSITIPSGVTSIGNSAFMSCSKLGSIIIPRSCTSIGEKAFWSCSKLTSIAILNNNISIGSLALGLCANLTSITIPCKFDKSKFEGTGITVSGNTFIIGTTNGTFTYTHSFNGKITYIWSDDNSTCIAMGTCVNCSSEIIETVNASVQRTATCTEPGPATFTATFINEGFETQTIDVEDMPATEHTLSEVTGHTWVKSGDVWEYRETGPCSVCGEEEAYVVTDVFVPNDYVYSNDNISATTRIWKYNTFGEITGIDHPDQFVNVEIPARIGGNKEGSYAVTAIGTSVFEVCDNLTSITIPNGVTSIGDNAFRSCSKLGSITIPNSVKLIDNYAFYNCRKLTSIAILNNNISIGSFALGLCSDLTSITIPCDFDKNTFDGTEITVIENSDKFTNCVNSQGTFTYTHNLIHHDEAPETCTEDGYRSDCWRCSECGKCFSDGEGTTEIAESSVVIPATGHRWGESYTWSRDQETGAWTCTATRVCQNDASHTETETVTITPSSVKHDGEAHDVVTVSGELTNAKILYSTDAGENWSDEVPTITDIGEYTVFVKVQNSFEEIELESEIYILGDINRDGLVNIFDLQMLYNHFAGIKMLTNVQMMPANLNNDTEINLLDLKALFNIITTS